MGLFVTGSTARTEITMGVNISFPPQIVFCTDAQQSPASWIFSRPPLEQVILNLPRRRTEAPGKTHDLMNRSLKGGRPWQFI
jgi:hypothetical protein